MPDEVLIDSKLFTLPTVVVQNLNIEAAPPEDFPLSELCKLPKVQLEKLELEMAPPAVITRPKIPKVLLEKLDLSVPSTRTSKSPQLSLPNGLSVHFSKVPVVALRRCDAPASRKRVSFSLPKKEPVRNTDVFRKCYVVVKRDDLYKLKNALKTFEKPSSCKLCGKVYLYRKKLLKHQERKHDLVPNLNKTQQKKRVSFSNEVTVHTMLYHRCRKCLKVFENYKILKMHMKSQHKKRTCYVCDYCKKLFADRIIFKVHIKLHCDRCHRLFGEKRELVQHRKTMCYVRRTRRIACCTCGETYFSNLWLKDHSYSHLEVPRMVCDECKDQFSARCPLIRHLYYAHTKRKNGVIKDAKYTIEKTGSLRVYTCKFCFEKFIDEKDIEKHLSSEVTVGIERKYGDHRCEYCPKKFKIEENLLQHMWSHLGSQVVRRPSVAVDHDAESILPDLPERDGTVKMDRRPEGILKNGLPENDNTVKNRRPEGILKNGEKVVMNGTGHYSDGVQVKKRERKPRKTYDCPKCNKTLSGKSSLDRHMKLHMDTETMRCHVCEQSFAWPSLLRDHACLRTAPPPRVPAPNIEIPVVNTEYCSSLGLDDDLPATNDVTTHIDFEIPAPAFEFAGIPEPYPSEVYSVSAAPAARGYRYKVVRQEVPIEF